MSSPRPKRAWAMYAVVAIIVVLAGTVLGGPRNQNVDGIAVVADEGTAPFGEEAMLAWGETETAHAMAGAGLTAAGLANINGQTMYGWGNGAHNVFSGDFNGDGKWDIGVTGTDKQNERCWYIRYGQGNGQFGSQTHYCWGNGVTNVFTGDFNGDGKWDIGVTGTRTQKDRNWYIRYGDGKGGFGKETRYAWNNGVTNVFTGDFNGDGKWDIGVTGTAEERDRCWYIRYGQGNGQFANESRYCWNNGVTNVFTGDFNGDGKWDIGVTGTQAQRERTWYIRYGDGKGNFGNEDYYGWGNGVTNVFTGDFNGDKLWDIGVTGDQVNRDGHWYIRYNTAKKTTQPAPPSQPSQPDGRRQVAGSLVDTAYQKLLGRATSQSERDTWINQMVNNNLAYEDFWTQVARSPERLQKFGYFAPAKGSYGGKTEQCFGAIGSKCEGTPVTMKPQWVNKFTRPDGVEMGYIKIQVNVGSILHDNICVRKPNGAWCSGWPTVPLGELPIIKAFQDAAMEWNKAVYNVRDGRVWMEMFGPYPTDSNLRAQYSDDLTQVPNRPSLMAKVGVVLGVGASPVTSEPYTHGETRQTAALKAPKGTAVDRGDAAYCASKQYREDGRWWTMQWWGVCQ